MFLNTTADAIKDIQHQVTSIPYLAATMSRRTTIGIIGCVLFVIGGVLWFRGPQGDTAVALCGACVRVGVVMLALWLAYEATGEQRYLDEVDRILGWIRSHLFVDGEIKHHWVNGRVASEAEDLYDFCSGCNLQTLYLFRTIEQFVTQGT